MRIIKRRIGAHQIGAARIGGEEMALVLTDTSSTKGRVAAERVRETVGRSSFDVGGV